MVYNIVLNRNDFLFFRDIITKESGIQIPETKFSLVQARLMRRLRTLKIRSYSDYRDFLSENYSEEIENFVNCITTNKTEFFREKHHFEFIRNTVLPDYKMHRKNKVRIWSAGCSTGEEPYSIAMTCQPFVAENPSVDLKLLATDIDTSVLEKAASGMYSYDNISSMEASSVKRFFREVDREIGMYSVIDPLKEIIRFRKLNLLSEKFPMKGPFDMIFCRNVIIYFDKPSQRKLFTNLHNLMDSGSYLFIGHSESLNDMSDMFRLVGRSIYRRVN